MSARIARLATIASTLSLACVLAATSGCRTAAPFGATPRRNTAVLSVENNDFSDRVIYVVMGGMRHRLGTARGAATTRFVIPESYVLGSPELRFLADVIGGMRPEVSDRTEVAPGDTVDMVIQGS